MTTKAVAALRPGDVILPPARELALWMRRDAAAKGLPESMLRLTVETIREGAPDKRGPWVIVAGYLPDAWYANGRRYVWTFKARPATLWPLAGEAAKAPPKGDA
jgi:hypothetical protein